MKDERLDTTYDYGRKERVLATGTILPEHAPKEYQKASVLFNAIEKYEKSENARTGKKIEVALPKELSLDQQKAIVEKYIRENITKKGYACAYAIHTDKSNSNPHAHILIANRQINDKGEWVKTKTKSEYAKDKDGNKIPLLDENGVQKVRKREGKGEEKLWKRENVSSNPLDRKEVLAELREQWAVECNKYLDKPKQIDHRSYEEQNREQIPTIHEGYGAREMEKRGILSERCEYNRTVSELNQINRQLKGVKVVFEVMQENESRLQDLRSVGKGETEESRIFDVVAKEQKTPVLSVEDGKAVVIAEQNPVKALSLLRATKEKWGEYIKELRERVRNAHTDVLKEKADKPTHEPQNANMSLLERVKGHIKDTIEDLQKKQADKQEQKRQLAEEIQQREKERQATLDKLNAPYYRHDTQQVLEKLEFAEQVYRQNINADITLKQKAFEKLGELGVIQTKKHGEDIGAWEVPTAEVFNAINTAKSKLQNQLERESKCMRIEDIQKANSEKIAQRQTERTKTQGKKHEHTH